MFRVPVSNRLRIAGRTLVPALALAAFHLAAIAQSVPDALATQSSVEQGVTVKVTPKPAGNIGTRWEFSVALDTHSADLSDDLAHSATLVTDDGRTVKPASWTGAAPGGHHREGVLAFEVPPPRPGTIELRIMRPGEATPRIFRWRP